MVLDRCTKYVETDGSIVELKSDKREELGNMISSMADTGLRTLCLSYRDYSSDCGVQVPEDPPDEDLTACCIVGIKVTLCLCFIWCPCWTPLHAALSTSGCKCVCCTVCVFCIRFFTCIVCFLLSLAVLLFPFSMCAMYNVKGASQEAPVRF